MRYEGETLSFNVMFNRNEKNIQTFEEFKEFCKDTTDNNYLQGIKNLLFTNKMLGMLLQKEAERDELERQNRRENQKD